jgi:vitamin B12 transporter
MRDRSTLAHGASCLAGLALLCPAVTAAQGGLDTVALPPVVVTATLVPMRVDDVSATVTVLSGAALRARGIMTVADALRTLPGAAVVTTGSFGGQTSLFLRGGESDYVKVLVDGVPQNQPGGFYDFSNLGIVDVDRIEIVRGPASVLYGSDAVVGVIQIFTRTGHGALSGQLSAGGGTYGTRYGTLDLGAGIGAWSYGLSVSQHATDGIYPVNNRDRRDLASGRVRFRPDTRTDLVLSARWIDGVYHFPTDYLGQITDSNQYTTARGPSVGIQAARVISSHLDAHVVAGVHGEQDRYDDGPDSPGDTGVACCAHSRDEVRREIGRGWVDLDLPARVTLSVGGEMERQRQTGTTLSGARRNLAAFAQILGHLGGAGNFTLGGRLDDNQEFGRHLTGRAGLSWWLGPDTRVRGSMGTGFKEPSFYENFASGYVHGNPALLPERSTSWEVALEQAFWQGRLHVSATWFDQLFADLIQYHSAPLGPDSVNYTNVAAATARGVEATASALLGSGFSIDGSLTHLDTRDAATGERLLRRPATAASAQVIWARARGDVSVRVAYTGARFDLDYGGAVPARVMLVPTTRVDVAGSFRFRDGGGPLPVLRGTVRVENLFDAPLVEALGFRAPGRTILLGAEIGLGR